jgi:hypothetical protein
VVSELVLRRSLVVFDYFGVADLLQVAFVVVGGLHLGQHHEVLA